MSSNNNIPLGVSQSFVSSDPLDSQGASGVSIEWIDAASPYRKYIAAYCYGSETFVQRDEIRFRRTKTGVIAGPLWIGKVSVARPYVCELIEQYLAFCVHFPSDRMPQVGWMDGDWYVIKVSKNGLRHVRYIWSPECSEDETLEGIHAEMELLLARPKGYFEDARIQNSVPRPSKNWRHTARMLFERLLSSVIRGR